MKRLKKDEGAVIVEATLVIPMFVFLVITFMWVANLCTAQAKIQIAINSAAKEISSYTYLYGLTGLNEKRAGLSEDGKLSTATISEGIEGVKSIYSGLSSVADSGQQAITGDTNLANVLPSVKNGYEDIEQGSTAVQNVYETIKKDPKGFLISLGSATASVGIDTATSYLVAAPLGKYFVEKHLETGSMSADQYLKKLGVVNGFEGIDFRLSKFCNSGSDVIEIVAVYQLSPIKFFNIDVKYNIVQSGKTKAWFGVTIK